MKQFAILHLSILSVALRRCNAAATVTAVSPLWTGATIRESLSWATNATLYCPRVTFPCHHKRVLANTTTLFISKLMSSRCCVVEFSVNAHQSNFCCRKCARNCNISNKCMKSPLSQRLQWPPFSNAHWAVLDLYTPVRSIICSYGWLFLGWQTSWWLEDVYAQEINLLHVYPYICSFARFLVLSHFLYCFQADPVPIDQWLRFSVASIKL